MSVTVARLGEDRFVPRNRDVDTSDDEEENAWSFFLEQWRESSLGIRNFALGLGGRAPWLRERYRKKAMARKRVALAARVATGAVHHAAAVRVGRRSGSI